MSTVITSYQAIAMQIQTSDTVSRTYHDNIECSQVKWSQELTTTNIHQSLMHI